MRIGNFTIIGRKPKDLTCQELVEFVTAYLENTLPPRERARFEAHIATCVNCTAYLQQIRETIRLTGALREETIFPDAKSRLLDTFRTWKSGT